LVRQGRFTNSSVAESMGKSKQQIQKYLRNWVDLSLASQAEKEGRNQFYEVDPRFLVLNEVQPNQGEKNG
jgi:predicted HTH transcriptional regulator